MESYTSVYKANFYSGLIMGLITVIYTLILYAIDFMFNPYQGYVFYIVQAVVLFIFIKSYRENYKNGYIMYGQAFAGYAPANSAAKMNPVEAIGFSF